MTTTIKTMIIIVCVFFIIGMIAGDYNICRYFCNTVTSLVYCITDIVKTEATGITTVVNWIAKVFA